MPPVASTLTLPPAIGAAYPSRYEEKTEELGPTILCTRVGVPPAFPQLRHLSTRTGCERHPQLITNSSPLTTPLLQIENLVDGEEIVVGHFSPEAGIMWDSANPLVWHSSAYLGGGKNNGSNYAGTGVAYAPSDGRDDVITPKVYSAMPRVIDPGNGGKVTIVGSNFRAGVITVTIADKNCLKPVFKSTTLIECHVPPGVGGPHKVVVTCNGVPSLPRSILAYNLPRVDGVSESWCADGSRLRVDGSFFIDGSTKCRIKGFYESQAIFIGTSCSIEGWSTGERLLHLPVVRCMGACVFVWGGGGSGRESKIAR